MPLGYHDITDNCSLNWLGQGITIFAIGVKRDVREAELRAIASDPDSEYMYMLEDWTDSLDKIMESLAYKACPPNIDGKHKPAADFAVQEKEIRPTSMAYSLFDL